MTIFDEADLWRTVDAAEFDPGAVWRDHPPRGTEEKPSTLPTSQPWRRPDPRVKCPPAPAPDPAMDALFKVPHMDPGNLLLRCPRCRSYGMAQLLGVTTRPDPTVAVGGADTIGDRIGYLGREPQFRYERWECSARHRFQIVINLARAPRSGP